MSSILSNPIWVNGNDAGIDIATPSSILPSKQLTLHVSSFDSGCAYACIYIHSLFIVFSTIIYFHYGIHIYIYILFRYLTTLSTYYKTIFQSSINRDLVILYSTGSWERETKCFLMDTCLYMKKWIEEVKNSIVNGYLISYENVIMKYSSHVVTQPSPTWSCLLCEGFKVQLFIIVLIIRIIKFMVFMNNAPLDKFLQWYIYLYMCACVCVHIFDIVDISVSKR